MMRRVLASLFLLTPLLASCSDPATPVAPADALLTLEEWGALGESPLGDWELPLGESPPEEVTLQGAPSTGEVMVFGNPDAGTNFPSGVHDGSFHAKDRIIPATVVIDAGQKVTFQMNPGHRVAIYKDGTRPQDINPGTGTFVLDPTNRMALQAAPTPSLFWTFHTPGRYLIICAIRRHFVDANQYGWVIVR